MLPSHLFDITFETEEGQYVTLPVRLYGAALLGETFTLFPERLCLLLLPSYIPRHPLYCSLSTSLSPALSLAGVYYIKRFG